MNFNWNFLWEIMPTLFNGLVVTIKCTVIGTVLAVVLGALWAMLGYSKSKFICRASKIFTNFVRSTPLLVQLYFLYYVGPEFGLHLSPLTTGILALGLHFSAYTAEVYRAGIDAVPVGQWEASAALNLGTGQTWSRIVLPQAIPPVLPALANYGIALLKETLLLSAITLVEVLQSAKLIGAATFRYLEPVTAVGVIFLVLSITAGFGTRWLERRMRGEWIV